MKSSRRFAALFCFCALLLSATFAPARADKTEDARKELADIYALFARSVKAGDADTVLNYESDDYVQTGRDGKVKTKAVADAEFRRGVEQLKKLQIDEVSSVIDTFQFDADLRLATLTNTQTLKATAKDKDGKAHEIVSVARSRDTWQWNLKHKAYRLRASQELEVTVTVDGQQLQK